MTETIITSSVIILVTVVLRFALKGKVKHRLIYAMWLVAAIRLVLPFSVAESSVSVMNVLEEYTENAQTVQSEAVAVQKITDGFSYNEISLKPSENELSQSATKEISGDILYIPAEETAVEAKPTVKTSLNAGEVFGVVWIVGTSLLLIWFAAVNVVFYVKLKRTRVSFEYKAPLKVYVTDSIASPCIFGLIRPAVYITKKAAGDREKLDFIITHELCHYRQGDMIWSAVRNLLTAFYWINPFVWAAAFISKQDCELSCDERAVEILGEENRISYGKTLVDMVAHKRKAADIAVASTSMSDGSGLKERIEFIVSAPKYSTVAVIVLIVAAAVTAGCTFTSATDDTPEETVQTNDIEAEKSQPEATLSSMMKDVENAQGEAEELKEKIPDTVEEDLNNQGKDASGMGVYEFGITVGTTGYNIKVKADEGSIVNGDIVVGGYTMYAYDSQGKEVSSMHISTGATGLNGVEFDLSIADEYFRFSKGETIVYSYPVGSGIYLAGFYNFDYEFRPYTVKGNEQLTNGFPREIKVSSHEMFIGENFTLSDKTLRSDMYRLNGGTYFTDHDGEKVMYIADFSSLNETIECSYYYCSKIGSSDNELPYEAVNLLKEAKDKGFITENVYNEEIEKISENALILYECDTDAFTVKAVTTDVPDENGFVYGNYSLRVCGKSSGDILSEIELKSTAVGDKGVAVKAENGRDYFKFSYPYSGSFICFGYPLEDHRYDGNLLHLCSLYGFDEDGQLFEYSTDGLDVGLYHKGNEIRVGNHVISEYLYDSRKILFRTSYSEHENGTLYTTLCGFTLDPVTREAELVYNHKGVYDEEIVAAAQKTVFVYQKLLSLSVFTPLEDENKMIEEYDRDGGYYQLDTSIAETEEELVEFIADASFAPNYDEIREMLFGSEPPRYKMIDGKLCYLNIYNGVPMQEVAQMQYVTKRRGDKADVYVMCRGLDYYSILECEFVKCPDGKWRNSSLAFEP